MITLNVATKQEAFNKAYLGIVGQGSASLSPENDDDDDYGSCSYRGGNGTKCGVGWLIDDKDYHSSMEGSSICELQASCTLYIGDITLDFLEEIQHAHDSAWANRSSIDEDESFITNFKHSMVVLCRQFELEMPK